MHNCLAQVTIAAIAHAPLTNDKLFMVPIHPITVVTTHKAWINSKYLLLYIPLYIYIYITYCRNYQHNLCNNYKTVA